MQQKTILAALSLIALLAVPVAQAKLYKWTDAQGRVHYSDKVPPEAVKQEREVKSKSGITVDKVDAAKSREQLEAERAAKAAEEERRRREEEVRRKQEAADRTLLLTFSNANEIVRARDDRVAAIDGQIGLTKDRLAKLDDQLQKARKRAADVERSGRGKPEEAYKRVTDLERQVDEYKTFVAKREAERAEVISKFNADLARYKELKGAEAQ